MFTSSPLEGKITGALVATSAPETAYSSASYALTVTNVGCMSVATPCFGLELWIAEAAASINVIAGFVYFMPFTSFLLGGKITGALDAMSAPETNYSSASYAPVVAMAGTVPLS